MAHNSVLLSRQCAVIDRGERHIRHYNSSQLGCPGFHSLSGPSASHLRQRRDPELAQPGRVKHYLRSLPEHAEEAQVSEAAGQSVTGTISAAVRQRFEAAARECTTCRGFGINRHASAQQFICRCCNVCKMCYMYKCCQHCKMCYKTSLTVHVANHAVNGCRCTLCSGTGAVGWEGKWDHKEPCPMCLGKRFVDCPECGGHFHRRIFSHHQHTGLTVTELVEAEQTPVSKLGD